MIVLPTSPLPQSANPKPLDYGGWQEPIAGGAITRLDRLGNRFSMDVVLPRMVPEPKGRLWVSKLNQAIGQVVQMAFPQVGFTIGTPGSPLVNGGGQSGMTLNIDAATAGYGVRDGQFFNLVDAAGNVYLHHATADLTLAGGAGALPLWPMMRIVPADNSAVNFAAPVIQGRLTGNQDGWTLERAGTRGLQFTITELR